MLKKANQLLKLILIAISTSTLILKELIRETLWSLRARRPLRINGYRLRYLVETVCLCLSFQWGNTGLSVMTKRSPLANRNMQACSFAPTPNAESTIETHINYLNCWAIWEVSSTSWSWSASCSPLFGSFHTLQLSSSKTLTRFRTIARIRLNTTTVHMLKSIWLRRFTGDKWQDFSLMRIN